LNQQERDMIDGLFERLRQAEQQQASRDPEAEALIQERMASHPAASYLLAQVVLMQEQGMKNLQSRVEQLEQDLTASRFSGSGGAASATGATPEPSAQPPKRSGWSNSASPAASRPGMAPGGAGQTAAAPGQGGGFLAGAMQTAVGVAGGMMLANAVSGLFSSDAEAADAPEAAEAAPEAVDEPQVDEPMDAGGAEDEGGLFGGLFGGGDLFGGDDEF
jgi:hypothetical protein